MVLETKNLNGFFFEILNHKIGDIFDCKCELTESNIQYQHEYIELRFFHFKSPDDEISQHDM